MVWSQNPYDGSFTEVTQSERRKPDAHLTYWYFLLQTFHFFTTSQRCFTTGTALLANPTNHGQRGADSHSAWPRKLAVNRPI